MCWVRASTYASTPDAPTLLDAGPGPCPAELTGHHEDRLTPVSRPPPCGVSREQGSGRKATLTHQQQSTLTPSASEPRGRGLDSRVSAESRALVNGSASGLPGRAPR